MGTRENRIDKAVLTSTNNLCFWAEIRKIMYFPVNPSFTIEKSGLRGSKLYRHVFVMRKSYREGEIDCTGSKFRHQTPNYLFQILKINFRFRKMQVATLEYNEIHLSIMLKTLNFQLFKT